MSAEPLTCLPARDTNGARNRLRGGHMHELSTERQPARAADSEQRRRGTITVRDAVKQFDGGVLAVDHVSLDVRPGEFVSLIGPSGCGKSTLLRLMAGLIPLTDGSIEVNGTRVTDARQDVALMFQKPTLLPWQTALQNTMLPASLQKKADAAAEEKAYALLDLVGLGGFEHTYPRHLSGGMQQRVALARLLMVGVEVLLLDEPFAAVDQLTRERLNMELLDVHQRTSATAVLVTHNITQDRKSVV